MRAQRTLAEGEKGAPAPRCDGAESVARAWALLADPAAPAEIAREQDRCIRLAVLAWAHGHGLTKSPADVLHQAALGKSVSEIAKHLHVSKRTIEKHSEGIRRKTGDVSLAQAGARVALAAFRLFASDYVAPRIDGDAPGPHAGLRQDAPPWRGGDRPSLARAGSR
jgi:DNA-binding NarL/FixJ family response regulator